MERVLLTNRPCIAMEGHSRKNVVARVLHDLNRVPSRVTPVVIVTNDSYTTEPVVVHESSQSCSNSSLLRSADFTRRIRVVAVLWFVLDADRVYVDSLAFPALKVISVSGCIFHKEESNL